MAGEPLEVTIQAKDTRQTSVQYITTTATEGNSSVTSGGMDQIRDEVRTKKAEGADLIKIFASESIRVGGTPTLSQEQLSAACGQQGRRHLSFD